MNDRRTHLSKLVFENKIMKSNSNTDEEKDDQEEIETMTNSINDFPLLKESSEIDENENLSTAVNQRTTSLNSNFGKHMNENIDSNENENKEQINHVNTLGARFDTDKCAALQSTHRKINLLTLDSILTQCRLPGKNLKSTITSWKNSSNVTPQGHSIGERFNRYCTGCLTKNCD